jgi:hypothetical protein
MTTYIGNGWENEYGLNLSINIKKLNDAIESGELIVNQYGDVRVNCNRMKEVNEKSKATHSLSLPKHKF